jgi:hypothetical protein
MKRLLVTMLSVFALSGFLLPVESALAHGSCNAHAFTPYYSALTVFGKASVSCYQSGGTAQHDRYKVHVCLQGRISGTWVNLRCAIRDSGTGWDSWLYNAIVSEDCDAANLWRTVFHEFWVYNNAGDLIHHQAQNEISATFDTSSYAGC